MKLPAKLAPVIDKTLKDPVFFQISPLNNQELNAVIAFYEKLYHLGSDKNLQKKSNAMSRES